MGGRGASSGMNSSGGVGISVTRSGETTQYFFTNHNGVNYYQRGIGGTPEPTPQNMSAKEFRQRTEQSGASVQDISARQKREAENKRDADREKTDAILNQAYAADHEMVRGSRVARKANRANRRNRN